MPHNDVHGLVLPPIRGLLAQAPGARTNQAPTARYGGHVTAVRERLWTGEAILPLLQARGMDRVDRTPLKISTRRGAILPAELLTLRRAREAVGPVSR